MLQPGTWARFSQDLNLSKPAPHRTAYYGLSSIIKLGAGLEATAEQHKEKGSRAAEAEQWQIKSY